MKVATVLGTRPEIIRLSRVIPLLDAHCDHQLIFTGQNADPNLSDIFFDELGVRAPDHSLGVNATRPAEQIGQILTRVETIIEQIRPDRMLILGDTNSGMAALVAKRHGIKVFHMEAGNRCFDDRVPEEVNRRVIDHSSDILMPYTDHARRNLLREGFPVDRVLVTGNPIHEVLSYFMPRIEASTVLADQGLEAGGYVLVTMHRAENVDDKARLTSLVQGLHRVVAEFDVPVLVSTHPRTRSRLAELDPSSGRVTFAGPFGLLDFIHLQINALCVVSDSGTVQEEAAIFGVPNVTIRDVTERPETLEAGSNILAGAGPDDLVAALRLALATPPDWKPPEGYMKKNVSQTVARIVLGYYRN